MSENEEDVDPMGRIQRLCNSLHGLYPGKDREVGESIKS